MGIKKQNFTPISQVRPDSKGRILLEPMVEIPAREKWLFENPEALASLRRSLADAKAGRVKSLGSFAKYAKEDEED